MTLALQCSTTLVQASEAGSDAGSAANTNSNEIAEIVVTAQRRAQSLETTPVAVSALSGDSMERNQIVSEADLQIAVPGLTVKASLDSNDLNYSLRGQTVDFASDARPSVLPYFNEVQVATIGSSTFYDLESVQVLKGPQGTLFGRNSTGGAVLFTSAKPTNEFTGYISETGGNYGLWRTEGALNVPVISDTLLLRVAGVTERQQGFQYNLYNNQREGNVRRDNFRVSVTFKPTEKISNDLVFDKTSAGGSNISNVIYNVLPIARNKPGLPYVPSNLFYTPGLDALFGPGAWARYLAANPGAYPGGIGAFAALQNSRGPFLIDNDSPNYNRQNNIVVTDITKWDINPNVQFKNIVGYTHLYQKQAIELDGSPYAVDGNGAIGRGGWTRQFSEEPQLIGKAFDDRLAYITGLYYSDERKQRIQLSTIFGLEPFVPVTNQINEGVTTNKTYAGYGQGTLDLSDIVGIKGLGFTAGGRYSSEKVSLLHLPGDVYISSPVPAGAVFENPLSDTFKKFSWEVGLQEQANQNLLLYIVSRRSFRSGGFNWLAPPLPGFGNTGGGSEFEPETATDVEIGAKFKGNFGSVPARLNIAAYNMWVDNIQRSNYVSIFGSLAGITVNVPQAEVSGIEFDGMIKPMSWLSLGGSLNATAARFTKDLVSVLGNPAVAFGPYPDTSKWSGDLFAEVAAPLSATLVGSVRGDQYAQTSSYFSSTYNTLNPGTEIPGYGITNFRVGLEDTRAGWSVTANVKNALNHVYYVGGIGFTSLFGLNMAVPGNPRTFTIEARYKF
jgi:iron complex outermembrane receptor protein